MNESQTTALSIAEPVTDQPPAKLPGCGLSALQRQAVELVVTEGCTHSEASRRLGTVHQTTISTWFRELPEVQEYADYLGSQLVAEARKTIQQTLSRQAQAFTTRLAELALGKGRKGKPSHKSQDRYLQLALSYIAGMPGRSPDTALQVQSGDHKVTIIWQGRD